MFDILDFFVSYVTSSFLLLLGWPFVDQAGWWICLGLVKKTVLSPKIL